MILEREDICQLSQRYFLSIAGEAEGPEEQEMDLEYVSTVPEDYEMYDPKVTLNP